MLANLEALYAQCPDDQQKLKFIEKVSAASKSFDFTPIENLTMPTSVKAKGRPANVIGSRIPSKHEQKQKCSILSSAKKEKTTKRKREDASEEGTSVYCLLNNLLTSARFNYVTDLSFKRPATGISESVKLEDKGIFYILAGD